MAFAAVASEVLGEDPFSGVVVVFRSKRSDRVKILVWDTSGLVLVWKQLQQNAFRWPPVIYGVMRRVQTTKGIPKPVVAA
jgi:transposase